VFEFDFVDLGCGSNYLRPKLKIKKIENAKKTGKEKVNI
jgi:hypothetical protein